MAVIVLCLFLMVPWVCLQCVIVAFPHHAHLHLDSKLCNLKDLGLEYNNIS